MLIYGRREEFAQGGRHQQPERLNKSRELMQGADEFFMTYDRLRADRNFFGYVCIARKESGFSVEAVPPSFTTHPHMGGTFLLTRNWEVAIKGNELISSARAGYLLERISHWRHEARLGGGEVRFYEAGGQE